ncbi:MAG: DUF2892 domain-containing protein [Methylovulum sp.]|nr:DUF2892 domain-containing protein [Methylovulum sp.]
MNFDFKRMMKFEHNIGANDKKYRLYGGVALIVVSIFTASILLLLIGLILAAEGFFGWCPLYSGLGKNTCELATAEVETPLEETNAES